MSDVIAFLSLLELREPDRPPCTHEMTAFVLSLSSSFITKQHTRHLDTPRTTRRPQNFAIVSSLNGNASRSQHRKQNQGEEDHDIHLICCDMDGTILDSTSTISSRNIDTVKSLIVQDSALFVPTTGKSRLGALKSMKGLGDHLLEIHSGQVPGVFLQGLVVYGRGGEMVYEKTLEEDISWKIVEHAKNIGVTIVAYNGDRIVGVEETERTRDIASYHEPSPIYMQSWEEIVGKMPLHKFLFLDEPKNVEMFRPSVENAVGDVAAITTAVPNMLEALPAGASKGAGAVKLLESFGVDPINTMCLVDGENDLSLIDVVNVSVAMGNALSSVKSAAKYVVGTNDDHGVSEAIERFVLSKNRTKSNLVRP